MNQVFRGMLKIAEYAANEDFSRVRTEEEVTEDCLLVSIAHYLIQYGINKKLFLEAEKARLEEIDFRKITEEELTFRLIFILVSEGWKIPEEFRSRSIVDLTRAEKEEAMEAFNTKPRKDSDFANIIFCKLPQWLEKNAKYL